MVEIEMGEIGNPNYRSPSARRVLVEIERRTKNEVEVWSPSARRVLVEIAPSALQGPQLPVTLREEGVG